MLVHSHKSIIKLICSYLVTFQKEAVESLKNFLDNKGIAYEILAWSVAGLSNYDKGKFKSFLALFKGGLFISAKKTLRVAPMKVTSEV